MQLQELMQEFATGDLNTELRTYHHNDEVKIQHHVCLISPVDLLQCQEQTGQNH